jgi:hypothetical protein
LKPTRTPSFAFLLAEKLGMTVAELNGSMSQDEYMRWQVYLGRKAQRRELEAAKARQRSRR